MNISFIIFKAKRKINNWNLGGAFLSSVFIRQARSFCPNGTPSCLERNTGKRWVSTSRPSTPVCLYRWSHHCTTPLWTLLTKLLSIKIIMASSIIHIRDQGVRHQKYWTLLTTMNKLYNLKNNSFVKCAFQSKIWFTSWPCFKTHVT